MIEFFVTISSVHAPSSMPSLSIRGRGPKKRMKFVIRLMEVN